MTNLLEQAINANDGDRAAKIAPRSIPNAAQPRLCLPGLY